MHGWNNYMIYSDYPRVCGGTTMVRPPSTGSSGLSPRVRGNRDHPDNDGIGCGTIPACAGEPVLKALFDALEKDYPRVCGGTDLRNATAIPPNGLSPRVRGNRLPTTSHTGVHRDYPRVCGGTPFCQLAKTVAEGLSPRVRGNPHFEESEILVTRTIPACAGEPINDILGFFTKWDYPRVCGGTS